MTLAHSTAILVYIKIIIITLATLSHNLALFG